ncbi:CvpA family protein [Acidocella aminolytica]|jgi:membrane protein required for colicin V production|uniref:Bacteriocin/colicin V production n=1 Tax=Acidocella aminolytica 101 = DSM 11237 TaxID=1120923 RepID=A0A0D6PIS7_9PROT|nr:CvpA family protein [Acidocella aminolytica]GAN81286.1 bacteriocin/colicin V production [Acidocella aminolytica 101 = DSM 11237]GBQ34176.1 putative colicin V production protein [Acidocella aminolytica 101 = DSM 11237]SHE83509.1 membrane protein required for colicin V production [Acidocella aminolytica 101 = DSM 11237]
MTWVDGVILGIVALSAVFSMVRGFVREVLGVAAWIGALFAALKFYAPVQPYVASLLPHGMSHFAIYGAMAAVFLITLIILSILSALIGGLVRDSALSGLDHSLGLVFGIARGAVIIFLGYIALGMAEPATSWPQPVAHARFLPLAQEGATWLTGFLPQQYQPKIQSLPGTLVPAATTLMKQPVEGSAL